MGRIDQRCQDPAPVNCYPVQTTYSAHQHTVIVEQHSGRRIAARFDDHTDPWIDPPVAVLLHGTAETGIALQQWVPWLSRHFRVVRPDLRGMGHSSPVGPDENFGLNDLADDLHDLLEALGVQRCHLAGAKLGGLTALAFAGRYPSAVKAVSVACGLPSPRRALGAWMPEWIRLVQGGGVRAWVDATQAGRMGDELQGDALQWWSGMMAGSMSVESLLAYFNMESRLELTSADLSAIHAPVQLMLPSRARSAQPTSGSSVPYDQRLPAKDLDAWQQIPRYFEAVIESNSFHVAATRPDQCATATLEFFLKHLD